jgi:hypothetical protein
MRTIVATVVIGAGAALAASPAFAQTFLDQAMEYRYQLDFHVNDAALQKMLPAGWEPAVAAMGPAKDANLRMIFIDRVDVMGQDGKPLGRGQTQLVYLAIPVKQTGGQGAGQMIIAGLTKDAADAPGAFGVYRAASTAKMNRSIDSSGAAR